jgi:hypothetical protein
MLLIGLTGFAGSGKDLSYQLLSERRGRIARAAFADALRVECATAFGCDVAVFSDPATKETPCDALAAFRCSHSPFVRYLGFLSTLPALKPRTIMKQWGDYRRDQHPDYWVRLLDPMVDAAREAGASALVVTDVRFFNELDWLRGRGGVLWRIVRPDVRARSGHASEWALNDSAADVTIVNEGDVSDLAARVTGAFDDLVQRAAA